MLVYGISFKIGTFGFIYTWASDSSVTAVRDAVPFALSWLLASSGSGSAPAAVARPTLCGAP